jgi:protein-L-isoaspartate(D-aspartate) O-methyltransferase
MSPAPDDERLAAMVRDQLADCPDPRVVAAMAAVPRHRFVPAARGGEAFADGAVPIAAGQTISQPRLVARMLALLALRPGDAVLDVGCGSGYVAALLARLVAPGGRVVAVERQPELVALARPLLAELAPTVELRLADGLAGAAGGPFAAIHVGAACPVIPRAFTAQLATGGRLVLPLGDYTGDQELVRLEKLPDGRLQRSEHGPVSFVPCLPGVPGTSP